jgi:hypothetical protein
MKRPLPPITPAMVAVALGVGVLIAGAGLISQFWEGEMNSKLAMIFLMPIGLLSMVGLVGSLVVSGSLHDPNLGVAAGLNVLIYGGIALPIVRRIVRRRRGDS